MIEILYIEACVKVKRQTYTQRIDHIASGVTLQDAHEMARHVRKRLETEYPNYTSSEHKVVYSQYFTREG
jgi:hypothetical protein